MSTSKRDKPHPYHHGNLGQVLIEVGLEFLEKRRESDFSLRELSKKVGVSANASYRHFADKDALLMALAAEGFRRMLSAQAKAASAEKDPMERHRAAGKAYVSFARANPALFRLMFSHPATKQKSEELKTAATVAFEALRAGSSQALKLPADDKRAQIAAIRAWSIVHGLSQLILTGHIAGAESELEPMIDAILTPPRSSK